jgi:hypothetical protein
MANQEFVQSQNKRVAKEEQVDLRWQNKFRAQLTKKVGQALCIWWV